MKATGVRSLGLQFPGEGVLSLDRLVVLAAVLSSGLTVALGFGALAENDADMAAQPALALLLITLVALVVKLQRQRGRWEREGIILCLLTAAGVLALLALPEWLYGYNLNAIIHRSFFSSIILLGLGTVALSYTLYHYLGATPTARDVSRYPLILLPIALALVGYGMVLGHVFDKGLPPLSLSVIEHSYSQTIANNDQFVQQAGLRNHILGTLLLIVMTCGIALPIGVGAGVHMAEYRGWTSRIIAFSTTMLRAISVFIIAVAAFNMVELVNSRAPGDPISDAIRGYYHDDGGFIHAGHGSFLLASAFLAILVIPVIARATDEGFRSVPREIREGSLALGATEGHAFTRLFFPWALPQILTGLLIGAAEAAGSVTVLLFIAGTGQNGVGPLQESTSLGYLIFQSHYGPNAFINTMQQYQFTAALLLLGITLTLTIAALYLKSRARARYRGLYAN